MQFFNLKEKNKMTFEEWWDRYSHELSNPEFVNKENHKKMAKEIYEAGLHEGKYIGDYYEGIEEGYQIGYKEALQKMENNET